MIAEITGYTVFSDNRLPMPILIVSLIFITFVDNIIKDLENVSNIKSHS